MAFRRSRSLFGKDHGYLDAESLRKNVVSSAVDDEDDDEDRSDQAQVSDEPDCDAFSGFYRATHSENPEGVLSNQGGPFSALTPSMWPPKTNKSHPDRESAIDWKEEFSEFDEFGFRVEMEDGPEPCSNKLLSEPFADFEQNKLKWIAQLEFSQKSPSSSGRDTSQSKRNKSLAWNNFLQEIPRTDTLKKMILDGLPHSLRPLVWLGLSGALKKRASSDVSYKQMVKASTNDHLVTSRQIEKDLLRTLPNNACFSSPKAVGVPRLRRILRALAWLYPDLGYCQGMGMIAATFLLLMEEEEAFWIMVAVIEDFLPSSYYAPSLVGVQADQIVLRNLMATYLPPIDSLLHQHDIELSLITLNWFITLYSSVIHVKVLLRLWDLFFFEGSKVLFQVAIAMMSLREEELVEAENSATIFNHLSTLPSKIDDAQVLLEALTNVAGTVSDSVIEEHRRHHVAALLAQRGSWNRHWHIGSTKDRLSKRTIKRSKSVIDMLLLTSSESLSKDKSDSTEQSSKLKNVRQTELMIHLRDAILRVAQYFQASDPNFRLTANFDLQTDYSMESHARDLEVYMASSRGKRKRARALLDFERKDDDELGFRKNDIITLISLTDEHCWVGELNGHSGWFPAKLVELLDERSKLYSFAGDDSVYHAIADLVRGILCPCIKAILEHGLKRSFLGPVHPWQFIEEASAKEVEKDFKSVYSRLVLCKTFRLNEDSKVLTPEELLFRCVEAVNFSHNPKHAQMDVKLRSLICMGLNEQVLHLWIEALASNEDVVKRWYQPWSFMASPGWVQMKCELRLLSKFSFNLNPEWELNASKRDEQKQVHAGVRDMLVTHHLFSWDL